jgi:predicted ATP-grasp superfamily ATP-dependent carboligase
MNPYYTGLGIARSLRGTGIPVDALASDRQAPGAWSRHFRRIVWAPSSRDDPAGLCRFLFEHAAESSSPSVLFPTRDHDVIFLDRYRDALAPHYRLPQPAPSRILAMMDKLELARVAKQVGVPTPDTEICSSRSELEEICLRIPFPLIVKPRFAYEWRIGDLWQRIGAQKAFVVGSRDELLQLHERIAPASPDLLVQRYIEGVDADIVTCCTYIGRDGEPKGCFTARKLRQSPPLVGTGCVVEARDCAAIVPHRLALLRAFSYAGIAEVEYKFDRKSGTYWLIEINPRHWDQHQLGTLAGVNVTRLAYADMTGPSPARAQAIYPPRKRLLWVAEPELVRDIGRKLLTVQAGAGESHRVRRMQQLWRECRELLVGRKIYGYASIVDPMPALMSASAVARDASLAAARRLKRRHRRSSTSRHDPPAGTDAPRVKS